MVLKIDCLCTPPKQLSNEDGHESECEKCGIGIVVADALWEPPKLRLVK